ncbi:hypothetical protein BMR02_13590 [Methylococcaceae bacterium HT1]|nr:hypothetical protein BMR02_13590 [Methylococcaceae bacterium HT1]TXL23198.1 hypothetical protein BMR03_03615 [Methylococcaceae bacterium HT2]
MKPMPTNLSEIQQLLADWYLFVLDNPLFVGVLVVVTWVLAAIIYNFKILLLKKKQKAEGQLHLEVQSKLLTAEQQAKEQQEKLAAGAEQMAKDKQLATEIQDKVVQRNQRIVENIRSIASRFDLSEQLVGVSKEMKDEFIWQQQDNIIQQLTDKVNLAQQEKETLQAVHQKEIAQVSEKDSVISNLQSSLDTQTKQFVQLEQAIEMQKLVQKQQQKEVQQQLSNTLEKHQLDFTQLINAVQSRPPSLELDTQEKNNPEEGVQQEGIQPEKIIEQQIVEFSAAENVSDTNVNDIASEAIEPVTELESVIEQIDKPEQLVEPEVVVPPKPQNKEVQDLLDIAEPTFSTLAENEVKQSESEIENIEPDYAKSSLNVAGKFKNLLGKVKKSNVKTEPEPEKKVELSANEGLTAPATNEIKTEPNLKVSGKFRNLMGKVKKPKLKSALVPELEPEQKIEAFTVEELNVPEAEQKIEIFTTDDLTVREAETDVAEPDYGASNFKVPGAFKKLFGKAKK